MTLQKNELLGDEPGDHRLTQADEISEEKTTVLYKQAEAARHRANLVADERVETLDVGIALEHDPNFRKQRLIAVIGK